MSKAPHHVMVKMTIEKNYFSRSNTDSIYWMYIAVTIARWLHDAAVQPILADTEGFVGASLILIICAY